MVSVALVGLMSVYVKVPEKFPRLEVEAAVFPAKLI